MAGPDVTGRFKAPSDNATDPKQGGPYKQESLAKGAGVSQATVSNLLKGQHLQPGPAKRLCEFFGLDPQCLGKPHDEGLEDGPRLAYCGSSLPEP